ncbi:sodium/potassium/calcium exchanger 1 isoform X3 [Neoarius graeffei]|uniref:sodium/potassium/calcium exchanger 1 isoform X3 n=1 Tax=Neoarius graeffei TaxID=443677 RepID=UPI00298CAB9E|nr:sodium/potassium/calcium exchanger 1 isoform X3 [Neoarius graeffei]
MYLTRRKRLQLTRIIFLLSGVLLCCIYQLTIRTRSPGPWLESQIGENPEVDHKDAVEGLVVKPGVAAKLTTAAVEEGISTHPAHKPDTTAATIPLRTKRAETTVLRPASTTNRTIVRCIYVDPDLPKPTPVPTPAPEPTHPTPTITISGPAQPPYVKGEYPQDIFSIEERQKGWVILHIFGMIYMFVSLAIVCDEFFVPTLGVITTKLEISDDVAGATFMAAGGSAPELFTSLIGVFISHSNVGIGTIVGSAVFNILFVIGMCALFSREMLYLTWWPLFRDVSFYIFDLIMLIIFFLDNTIMWWESIMLVGGYVLYVYFMKYNVQLEQAFKSQLRKHKNIVKVIPIEEPEKPRPILQRGGSSASLHNSTMRNTIFQLMIHTLDPLGEGDDCKKEETKESKEPAAAPSNKADTKEKPEGQKEEKEAATGEGGGSEGSEGSDDSGDDSEEDSDEDSDDEDEDEDQEDEDEDGENDEPLSLAWPDTRRKQATYLFLLPIVFPLWLTVPDVRNPASKKYFVITFLGSIGWIAIFSYLMVWWAHQVGETIGISEEIMGLTILAAGTSIPDLITSVIVARKGLGDMAVSSSVGSNIFDITMGLPVPWLMYSSIHGLAPVAVSSNGLFCAIVLLFLMLLFVIISIAACKWRMNKMLGFTMFMLYFVFLVLSVMLEDRIIVCPVSI